MKRNLEKLRGDRAGLEKANHLCFFGMGALLRDCYDQIVSFAGRTPDFFCDNDPHRWGTSFKGIPCAPPSRVAELRQGVAVVITIRRYEAIYSQLASMGISNLFAARYGRGYNYLRSIKACAPKIHDSVGVNNISGKWALITGSTRGIGRQIAIEMAKLGCNIIVHGRGRECAQAVANECSMFDVETIPVAADLCDTAAVDGLLRTLTEMPQAIDFVFNNAAISPTAIDAWSAAAIDLMRSYIVNTIAPIRLCQALIPPMIQRRFGRVIMITSSIQRRPDEMAYACSKAAIDKFTHDLSYGLKGTGVAMSSVDPGWVKTDMGGTLAPSAVESVIPGVLLGAVMRGELNGRWFVAQDYTGMSLKEAMVRAALDDDDED